MKKIIPALFIAFFFPLLSHAACTEKSLDEKVTVQLRFRMDILKSRKKEDDFVKKAGPLLDGKKWLDYRAGVMAGKDSDESKRGTLCTLADGLIAMADDMLAGGDGTGSQKPWQQHTPEEVYEQKLEFDRLCDGEYKAACQSDAVGILAMQFLPVEQALEAMKITPGEYIDQGYDLYRQLLDTLKGKNTL